jgi:LacI family transcriptional regulator
MNIRTIAQKCGVSISTVSRILNNRPDVNTETREKVISIMNEMGFRPTIVASRHGTIGVVTPIISLPEFMGELMNGIMETAYAMGKNLTLIPLYGGGLNESEDIKHFCRSNGLHGMMVINPPMGSKLPNSLMENQIPHIIIASTNKDSDISWVDVDNTGGCKDAVNHLIENGHRNIALFHNKVAYQCEYDRILGYRQAFLENGININSDNIFEIAYRGMDLSDPIQHMMQSKHRPTAIFCTTFRETLSLLNHLQKLHINVPDDISLVGFGDYDVSPLTSPPMTTVHQPIFEMGKTAVTVLEELLKQTKYEKKQVMIPTRLMIRKSTKSVQPKGT